MSLFAALRSDLSLGTIDVLVRRGRAELFVRAGKTFVRFLENT